MRSTGERDRYRAHTHAPDGSLESTYDTHVMLCRDESLGGLCFCLDVTTPASSARRLSARLDLATGAVTFDARMAGLLGREPGIYDCAELMLMVHPDDRETVRGEGRSPEVTSVVCRGVLDGGEVRWFRTMLSPDVDQEGVVRRILSATIDVTDARSQRDRVLRSQKLEAIGTLTAGIAHDFRDTLGVLRLTLDELTPVVPAAQAEVLDDMNGALSDATSMVEQLMHVAGCRERPHVRRARRERGAPLPSNLRGAS